MYNLEKEVVKIRFFWDVNAFINKTPIEQGGSYEVDFL
jgi:hypothetical protein